MLLLGRTLSPSTKVTSLCLRSVRTRFATCSIIGELKRVVLKPPAFFVYLGDDPEIAAHTPLLLFGHVLFCMAVSIGFAWVVSNHGPTIIPWCLLGKAAVYPLYLYVWIVQRYGDEFFYYRNLGVRRRELLGVSCGVDFILCYVLLKLTAAFLYEPL